jgi:NifU-like protein involved in Fe-S cluster formation
MKKDDLSGYGEKLIDHYRRPRNAGPMEGADGVGSAAQTGCGDLLVVRIKVREEQISEIRFECTGCPAAVAAASAMTEAALGLGLDEAAELPDTVVGEAAGLPHDEWHCATLACDALHNAIMDHVTREIDRLSREGARRNETRDKTA